MSTVIQSLGMLPSRLLNKLHSISAVPDWVSIALENSFARLRGRKVRFRRDIDNGSILACENALLRHISDRSRGFWLYRDGIDSRATFLFRSYCLQNILFNSHDIVLDCGANSGDLFLSLSALISPENYFAFEPNPADFRILRYNLPTKANLIRSALGDSDGNLDFYVCTRSGDSSLIEPNGWDEIIHAPVVRLDSFLTENHISTVKLLKIEAEGFEPEVLLGLGKMLACCEYIAIDGGYERGKERGQTLTTCTNYLIAGGFEIIDVYFPWYRALFKRK